MTIGGSGLGAVLQEAQQEILHSLVVPGRQLSPEVSRALHDLAMGDKKPSDLPASTMIEVRPDAQTT